MGFNEPLSFEDAIKKENERLKGAKEVCKTVEFLIKNLKSRLPEIREIIKKGTISFENFEHVKYNGCEIIP